MTMRQDDEPQQGAQEPASRNNSKRQRRLLNWRMDPEESRSDFVIEIAVRAEEDEEGQGEPAAIQTFHVHTLVLEFGLKASGYFAALFASPTAEAESNQSRISLYFEQAKAFPLLPDFMYGLDDGTPALTIENAAPLCFLADYFEVESLQPKILQFWEGNMRVDNLAVCLEQAITYGIDSLRKIVVQRCATNIAHVAVDPWSPLLDVSDSEFWLDVKEEEGFTISNWTNFIVVVAEFCFKQKEKLEGEVFNQLVPKLPWPLLPVETVVKLLEVEKAVLLAGTVKDEEITEMQRFALGCLVQDWRSWKESTKSQDMLKKTSLRLFSLAMNMSLEIAEEETKALGQMLNNGAVGFPTTVSLTGAGIAEANGVYSLYGLHNPDGIFGYEMEGCWKGHPANYCIEISSAWTPTAGPVSVWKLSRQMTRIILACMMLRCLPTRCFLVSLALRVGMDAWTVTTANRLSRIISID